ncbi:AraC family transcriptional regulator [Paenibacillus sp. GYB003]|uniref:AraC family transcriptional regulator n=1 Tax=Paenibacillus sp. GYB003 TaxID=2994392 RepID=UPI002F96870F
MKVTRFKPAMPLAPFVDCFWHMEGYLPPHSRELSLPDGSAEIVVDLREGDIRLFDLESRELRFRGSVVCGPHTRRFAIDTTRACAVVGIHFKPGGLRPFIGMPAGELLNGHVPLEAIWGSAAGTLRDRLLECGTPAAMFRLLERTLLAAATRPPETHPAVAFALRQFECAPGGASVAAVIGQTGLTHKRLIELFRDEVGMTPQKMRRLFRFQKALQLMNGGDAAGWAELAVDCGCYDQAHFIKEFRDFSGFSPTDYTAASGRHPNHAAEPRQA